MNLSQFKYAVEIEKAGSITQAAENLFMGQPNLSKAIKELETELSAYTHMERIPFSSVSGEGVDALKKVIEKAVN